MVTEPKTPTTAAKTSTIKATAEAEAPAPAAKAPAVKRAPAAKKAPAAKVEVEQTEIFSFKTLEVPAALRDLTQTTVQQSKDAYEKFKSSAEEATSALEETFAKSRANVFEFNRKTMEAAQENTDATLAHFKDVFAVKTFSEVMELQTSFFKKQTELLQGQAKEFQDLTQRITEEAAEPYKVVMQKTAQSFKVA